MPILIDKKTLKTWSKKLVAISFDKEERNSLVNKIANGTKNKIVVKVDGR
jgi:hypothetical protein